MKTLLSALAIAFPSAVYAAEYDTPACYAEMPVTCSFNEMTLALCNQEGQKSGTVFLGSQRIHKPGGNMFGSADTESTCTVRKIKDSEPARYTVTIN